MKKKVLSALLSATLIVSMLAGCGDKPAQSSTPASQPSAAAEPSAQTPAPEASVEPAAAEEGKVLNIHCWNDEFATRLVNMYPGFEATDVKNPLAGGKIGDVQVVFTQTANKDNAYQNKLDENLLNQANAAADDKIDMFLIEADYALKYVNSDYSMPLSDLGITDADLANQYQYTKDVVTVDGKVKGISWQGCPGVLFYNREAAKEVFGTDDAAAVQEKVKDWDTFVATAAEVKAKGYTVMSSANDSYRVYSNNVTSKWVVDGKINIDPNIKKWVDDSKALVDAGYTGTYDLWSDDWSKGFYPEGKVFCYFGPAWFVNFSITPRDEATGEPKAGTIGAAGGWGITEGPQSFNWGGTWICAATGTDNVSLVKDIMLKLCCDETIMTDIVKKYDDFVNNKPAMEAMAADSSYKSEILGGINPLSMYVAGAETCDMSQTTIYDQGCNEEFQSAMKNYFEGKATYDEALQEFYKKVTTKYPELTY